MGPISASQCHISSTPSPPGGSGLRDRLQFSGSIIVSRMYRINPQPWMIYPHPLLNMRAPFSRLDTSPRCFFGDILSCASKVRTRCRPRSHYKTSTTVLSCHNPGACPSSTAQPTLLLST